MVREFFNYHYKHTNNNNYNNNNSITSELVYYVKLNYSF